MVVFCECNSEKYRWRDIAKVKEKYFKVDEKVFLCDGEDLDDPCSTFDVYPIFEKIAEEYSVDVDDVILASFDPDLFPDEIVKKFMGSNEIGGYCAVCGGDL